MSTKKLNKAEKADRCPPRRSLPRKTKMNNSNDNVPEDEMLLATLIAEVRSRGWSSCRGSFFKDSSGRPVGFDSPTVSRCCVLGAAELLPGARIPFGAVSGNDGRSHVAADPDGYALGQSFYDACWLVRREVEDWE